MLHSSFGLTTSSKLFEVSKFPLMRDIQANADIISSVTIVRRPQIGSIEVFDIRGCSKLERFRWLEDPTAGIAYAHQWNAMTKFLQANASSLKEIVVEYHHLGGLREFFGVLVHDCSPSLQHLGLQYTEVNLECIHLFWVVCRGLTSLKLVNVKFMQVPIVPDFKNPDAATKQLLEFLKRKSVNTSSRSIEEDILNELIDTVNVDGGNLFPRMKKIALSSLRVPKEDQLAMMKQCPNLESIVWDEYNTGISSSTLLATISSENIWPNLHSLQLPWFVTDDASMSDLIVTVSRQPLDQNKEATMSGRPRRLLKALLVPKISFGRASLDTLQRGGHFETIQDLDLASGSLNSKDVLFILTSCPHLVSIKAPNIHAADVVMDGDRPWVCLKLRSWTIGIETYLPEWAYQLTHTSSPATLRAAVNGGGSVSIEPPTMLEMNEACLKQLGHLRQLQVMKISTNNLITGVVHGINLLLDYGLGQLEGIVDLEEVSSMIAESSTHRALFAPELLVLICQHLQAGILFNTIQVCKFWYSLLQPLLFVDLRISYETRQSEQEFDEGSIMMSYIRANMHKLRHVTIINTPIQDIHCFGLRNFKNLERFVWKGTLGAALSQTNSMLDFLSANASNLREVVFEVLRESARLWRVLAQDCSKLRSLSISKMRINDESDPWFWMACRNLVSLELRDTYHPAHWDMLASTDLDASFEGFQEALNIAEPRTIAGNSIQGRETSADDIVSNRTPSARTSKSTCTS
ncbi:hypothetical protein BGX27_006308 [Mortierella sp. AM989]|nr:hypothetical protein BGX27_006308 [Mortierella sp. AM989]